MITIFYKLIRNMSLKLPKNTSLQDLYLEDDQTIWFLIWILKQFMPCDRYISEMILESPFQVIQGKNILGGPSKYALKNGQRHGLDRLWHLNGQLWHESYWKNGQEHGLSREWYSNGQLDHEHYWKNGERHGLSRGWYQNGKLVYESHWKNGQRHGQQRAWYENCQLKYEWNWENGTVVSSKKIE